MYDEQRIIARCLAGDAPAWESLFRQYHDRLIAAIRFDLTGGGGPEQAEEIAAAVWFALCRRAYAGLRAYDPNSGRLLTYMAAIGRREMWKRRREELSRRSREARAARADRSPDGESPALVLEEVFRTLTPREREFCLVCLAGQARPRGASGLSAANEWKLRSRVLKKFRLRFLHDV